MFGLSSPTKMENQPHADDNGKSDNAESVGNLSKRQKAKQGGKNYPGVVVYRHLTRFREPIPPGNSELPERSAGTRGKKHSNLEQ
jgi:hypothetical protein